MARILKAGDEINGYTIESEINRGNFAAAYLAKDKDGRQVFLKAFKSPSPMVPWYRDFIEYQQEMRERIESTTLHNFICRILDFFEAPVPPRYTHHSYYQVFEYVARGSDLQNFLEKLARNPKSVGWETRVIWAKVIMGSIRQMHAHKLVHGDLKPANLMLIADRGIKVGYRLKVIDIDFAIMIDRSVPWSGDQGYVGTIGYLSPEHYSGKVPQPASDVFTCGLILSELLAGKHPFSGLSDEAYKAAVERRATSPKRLDGKMPGADDGEVLDVIHRALDPDPGRRPTAEEVLDVLNGVKAEPEPLPPPPPPPPGVVVPVFQKLRLKFEGFELPLSITTKVNRHLVQRAGEDSRYWDAEHQFTLERRAEGWFVMPNLRASNETLHNGKAIRAAFALKNGDEIGVGRESKGIVKTPARVQIE